MKDLDYQNVADALLQARLKKQVPLNRAVLHDIPSIGDAVKIAQICMSADDVQAWKLGGTTMATRNTFSVSVPYFGPLKADEVHKSGVQLNKSDFIAPVVEPEIVVCLARDITEPVSFLEECVPETFIEWIAFGMELPDTCLGNAAEAGVNWLVADRCAAGALILGEQLPLAVLTRLEQSAVSLFFDEDCVSEAPAGNIIGGVLASLDEAVREFLRYDIVLKKGQLISTGGLCPAKPLPETGASVRAILGDAEVVFEFSV